MQPNAVFKSSIDRECSTSKADAAVKFGSQEFDHAAYQTQTTFKTNKIGNQTVQSGNEKSSFGLFNDSQSPYETGNSNRVGQDQGYSMLLNDHMSRPGFNATQPRFNYNKESLQRAEVPGPGSYARYNTQEAA